MLKTYFNPILILFFAYIQSIVPIDRQDLTWESLPVTV
jgi:hypothetical protein